MGGSRVKVAVRRRRVVVAVLDPNTHFINLPDVGNADHLIGPEQPESEDARLISYSERVLEAVIQLRDRFPEHTFTFTSLPDQNLLAISTPYTLPRR